jgi:PAS domain S-box-containing protein
MEPTRSTNQNSSFYQYLIENAFDVVHTIDEKGNYKYISPSFERVLGYTLDEIKSKPAVDMVHADDLPHIMQELQKLFAKPGTSSRSQARIRHKNGDYLVMDIFATNLLHIPEVTGIVVNSHNITDIKQIQKELEQRIHDLEELNKLMVGRELRMAELKKEVTKLTSED